MREQPPAPLALQAPCRFLCYARAPKVETALSILFVFQGENGDEGDAEGDEK